MMHLRVISPAETTEEVLSYLVAEPAVANLVVHRGAAVDPAGDVVIADVARESANDVLRTLKPEDEQHAARFVALCQRALAHMKWEEARLFPGLESLAVDWARLEGGMDQRREELVVAEAPVVAPT